MADLAPRPALTPAVFLSATEGPWPRARDLSPEERAQSRHLTRAVRIAAMVPDDGIKWDPRLVAVYEAEGVDGLKRIARDDAALFCTGLMSILEHCYG
jgi:hypothetical protein